MHTIDVGAHQLVELGGARAQLPNFLISSLLTRPRLVHIRFRRCDGRLDQTQSEFAFGLDPLGSLGRDRSAFIC